MTCEGGVDPDEESDRRRRRACCRGTAASRQHLVQDDTKTPEVDAVIDRIAPQLLWRHVGDRAEHHARRSDEDVGLRLQRRLHRRGDLHLRQTEVEDLHEPATCLNQLALLMSR